jgi:hypothetical protein
VQAKKKEKPTALSSTFHFARASQNKKSLPLSAATHTENEKKTHNFMR